MSRKSTVTAGTVASTESATAGVDSEELVVSAGITGRNKPEAPGSIPTRGMPEEEAEGEVSKTTPPGEEGAILTHPDCEDLELGCPVRVPDGSEKQELIRKQKEDTTLADCWRLGGSGLRGYGIRNGVLRHKVLDEAGELVSRFVVPEGD